MDRSYRILPTYTGDVSGAASALYELGGMVVIHDPSGCNSTYNTHDEIRWYDRESLIFISGLAARDAVLGNDNKFVKDVCDTADYYRPAFIALVSSPIPFMNGTDFPALARIIERRTGIRTFFVMTNGMHDYVRGAGNAFLKIAENFVAAPAKDRKAAGLAAAPAKDRKVAGLAAAPAKDRKVAGLAAAPAPTKCMAAKPRSVSANTEQSAMTQGDASGLAGKTALLQGDASGQVKKTALLQDQASGQAKKISSQSNVSVNILGLTPLDFAAEGAVDRLRELLRSNGFDVLACWAMGSTLDDLRKSAEADVNLVVSSTGLQTAHFMEEKFGIPFVAGLPVGAFTQPLLESLAEAAGSGRSALPCRDLRKMQTLGAVKASNGIGTGFISPENAEGPSFVPLKNDENPSAASAVKETSPGTNEAPSAAPADKGPAFGTGEELSAGSAGKGSAFGTGEELSAGSAGKGSAFGTGEELSAGSAGKGSAFGTGEELSAGSADKGSAFGTGEDPSAMSVDKGPSLFTAISNKGPSLFTVGEVVAAGSYAAAVEMQTGRAVRVVTPLEDSAELLGPGDLFVTGETEVEEALKDADLVIGDAFYEAVCPAGCEFISLPHLAFSGRNAVKDLRTMDPFDIDSLLAGRHRLP